MRAICRFFGPFLAVISVSSCAAPKAHVFAATASEAEADGTLSKEKRDAIDARVRDALERADIVGLGLAVVVGDHIAYARGFGLADVAKKIPVDTNTRFRLASISKLFTAVATMHEVEAGHLSLDAPVQTYVPSFPMKPWPVTARELITHTSGIRHYRGAEMISRVHYDDLITPLAIFSADPLLFEPGTKFSYSSYGFNLLGAEVEAAAHRSFADEIAAVVFQPAEMITAGIDDETQHPARAKGYAIADGEVKDAPAFDPSNKIPSGGFLTTASDLARFAIAMDRDRLVRAETKRAMWTKQTLVDGTATSYGLGFGVGKWNGLQTIVHDGGQPGTSTALFMIPEKKSAFVVLTNTSDIKLDTLTHDLATIVLEAD
ncbi:MAG: serine hydrolase domain-containing protein [Polyangiaceae bacterium]